MKDSHWKHPSRALVFGLTLGLVLGLTSIASAIGPIITGVVSDRFGRPIVGAHVSDGARSTTTDTEGRYTFFETSPGTYHITASKTGFVTSGKTVNVLTNLGDQNITLRFVVGGRLDQSTFNTEPGAATLSLTVTSTAPDPLVRSCAFVTDTGTGTGSPMQYGSSSQGVATWTFSRILPMNSPEGTFTLSFWVENCSTTEHLDFGGTRAYTVDNYALGDEAPIARNDTGTTPTNRSVTINLMANDEDPDGDDLTYAIGSPQGCERAMLGFRGPCGVVRDNRDGTITYTPDLLFIGTDSFDYTIDDGRGRHAKAIVTVHVGLPE